MYCYLILIIIKYKLYVITRLLEVCEQVNII